MSAAQAQAPHLQANPGLTALVVYLRPAHRPLFLGPLTELGIFLHEVTADQLDDVIACRAFSPDLVTVVGGRSPDDLRTVSEVASALTPAVLAIWSAPAELDAVLQAGAMSAVAEDEITRGLAPYLGPVARVARELRAARALAAAGLP